MARADMPVAVLAERHTDFRDGLALGRVYGYLEGRTRRHVTVVTNQDLAYSVDLVAMATGYVVVDAGEENGRLILSLERTA